MKQRIVFVSERIQCAGYLMMHLSLSGSIFILTFSFSEFCPCAFGPRIVFDLLFMKPLGFLIAFAAAFIIAHFIAFPFKNIRSEIRCFRCNS